MPRRVRPVLALVLVHVLPLALSPAAAAPPASVASAASATAPTLAADPLEQLRARLTARLAGSSAHTDGRSDELRLVVKTGAGPAPSAPVAAAHRRAARGAREKAPPPAVAPAWAYEGPGGPSAWGTLQPAYSLCGSGREQSPIDIRDGLAVDLEPVHFNYQPGHFAVLDTGRTVQVKVAPGDRIEVAGRPYQLESLDFHHPAEERIDGRGFPMSVHLVHRDADGRVAVVALLVEPGEPQPVVQQVWNNLPLDRDDPQPARELLDPTRLLPVDRRYATYLGSLTQPPCTEGVRWIVMRQPITLSPEQIALFARLYPMNARPLQPARARRILQSR